MGSGLCWAFWFKYCNFLIGIRDGSKEEERGRKMEARREGRRKKLG